MTLYFAPSSLPDLTDRLNVQERDAKAVITSVEKILSTATTPPVLANAVDQRRRGAGENFAKIEFLEFATADEEEQRLRIEAVLLKGNAPLDYTRVVVLDGTGTPVDTDVFFYRTDGGAWLNQVAGPATPLGVGADRIPWNQAKRSASSYKGLSSQGIAFFPKPNGNAIAVTAVTDADIDTDGPGGSKAQDRFWQPHTSLRFADGSSCDSRTFAGVVIPPGLKGEFGIRMGDFALLSLNGREVPAQVYDGGPSRKIGEISFGAAVDLGIYPDRTVATERKAANAGNEVTDLLTVFFPGSGNGRAVSAELTAEAVALCLKNWFGAAQAPVTAPVGGTFAQFIASLKLKHVTLTHALGTTGTAPNAEPPAALWHNIAPTLTVIDAIAEHFGGGLAVNSTYRNAAYNNVVGGAKRSQHAAFRAVDFSIARRSPEEVAAVAKSLRGQQFMVPIANLILTNRIPDMATPPPLNLSALSLNTVSGSATTFVYHGGIQDYDSFVHLDCRGDDVSWG